jgi:predicted ATPase/class 3 adenylate cyclase
MTTVDPPVGTVTFLFTDLESSTRLWEEHPEAMRDALKRHDALLQAAVEAHCGYLVKTTGDGIHAAFATADAAVLAAIDGQRALVGERWESTGPLKVRMGIHTGAAELRDGDYYGTALNRAARLMAAAHGGQIVISHVTEELVRDELSNATEFVDLGDHLLRDLGRPMHLFQVCDPDLPRVFSSLRSLDALPTNLPAQATAFVGRRDEMVETASALEASHLVTLTGVGGVGKTRLALQVAADVLPNHGDGVWLIELGGLADAASIEEEIASTLGVTKQRGETLGETLLSFLRGKRLLLLLDNCEHLLTGVTKTVQRILAAAPGVVVLATSREPLGLGGERILGVPSLQVPEEEAGPAELAPVEAVELFVDRARSARAGFRITPDNAGEIAQLCRRLDGIPLAIELAAVRVRSMSPGEIATRLDQRFRLLTGSARGATSRHQTLRNAIDWSYDLLDEDEREILGRLSVCVGGFDLTAAERVGAGRGIDALDVDDLLGRLVDKSLVLATERSGSMRYRMLETIRAYALERIEEAGALEEVRRRHADHYTAFVADAGIGLKGADERAWLERVEDELDNLRAVVAWSLDGDDPEAAVIIVSSLALQGLRIEATVGAWAAAVAQSRRAERLDRYPVALAFVGLSLHGQGRFEEADRIGGEALARLDGSSDALIACRVLSLRTAVTASGGLNPYEPATQWVAAARRADDRYEEALALNMLAIGEMFSAGAGHMFQSDDAIASAEQGLSLALAIGCPSALAYCSFVAAMTLIERDPGRAGALFEDAIRHARDAANYFAYVNALGARSTLLSRAGDHAGAARTALESAREALVYGHRFQLASQIWSVAGSLVLVGRTEAGAVLLGWAASVLGSPAEERGAGGLLDFDPAHSAAPSLAALEDELGEERCARLAAQGAAMSDEAVVQYAVATLAEETGGG